MYYILLENILFEIKNSHWPVNVWGYELFTPWTHCKKFLIQIDALQNLMALSKQSLKDYKVIQLIVFRNKF